MGLIEGWADSIKWMVDRHVNEAVVGAAHKLASLVSIGPGGSVGIGDMIDQGIASINASKNLEEKYYNLGVLKRAPEDVALQDLEKKMFAVRSCILTFVEEENGSYMVTPKSWSMIKKFGETMEVRIDKKFSGRVIPVNKVCFKVVSKKEIRNVKTGETTQTTVWQKDLTSMIRVTADGSHELWFTWNAID